MILRDNFSNFFNTTALPALHHIIKEEWGKVPTQWDKLFRVETSDRDIEQTAALYGTGLFRQIDEGDVIQFDQPGQGYTKTFRHTRYGLGIKITQDAIEDEKFGLIARNARSLARSQRQTLEVDMASVFNLAFSAAGPDGVALCHASHPIPKTPGSVQSNTLGSPAVISVSSLELALTAYRTMKDDTGNDIALSDPKVVVPPKYEWATIEILKSKLRSDTAENAINAFQAEGILQHMVYRYLTNTENWFLCAPPEETELIVFWRRKPYTKGSVDDDSEVAKTMRRYRKSHGFAHYLGVFGVQGA